MKTKKEILKQGKYIFKQSQRNGVLDEGKLTEIIKAILSKHRVGSVLLLEALLGQLERYFQQNTLVIESPDGVTKSNVEELKSHFEKRQGKSLLTKESVSDGLLGGVKVTLGDSEWNFSVKERIKQLKESFYV